MAQSPIHESRIKPRLCLAIPEVVGMVIGLLSLPVPSLGADDARATPVPVACSEVERAAWARKLMPYIQVQFVDHKVSAPYLDLIVELGEPAIEPCLELLTSTGRQDVRRSASVAIWAIMERKFAEEYDARFVRGQSLSEDDLFHAQESLEDQFREYEKEMAFLDTSGAPIEANIAKWKQWLNSSRPIPLERHSPKYQRDGFPRLFYFLFPADCRLPLRPSYASERKKRLEGTIALLQRYKDSPGNIFQREAKPVNEEEKKSERGRSFYGAAGQALGS